MDNLPYRAGTTGLEPATSRVTGGCSNQLSYDPALYMKLLFLCQLKSSNSHRHVCRWEGSNLRPWAYESHALTN